MWLHELCKYGCISYVYIPPSTEPMFSLTVLKSQPLPSIVGFPLQGKQEILPNRRPIDTHVKFQIDIHTQNTLQYNIRNMQRYIHSIVWREHANLKHTNEHTYIHTYIHTYVLEGKSQSIRLRNIILNTKSKTSSETSSGFLGRQWRNTASGWARPIRREFAW